MAPDDQDINRLAMEFHRRIVTETSSVIRNYAVSLWGPHAPNDPRPVVAGSGTLLAIADEHFLLTASHVSAFGTQHGVGLWIAAEAGPKGFEPLAGAEAIELDEDVADVAVVRLPAKIVERLVKSHRFLRLTDVDPADRFEPKSYYITHGYPHVFQETLDDAISVEALAYASFPYKGDVRDLADFDPRIHAVLEYKSELCSTVDEAGREGQAPAPPHPSGISGGGIWRIYRAGEVPTKWSVDGLRLVGIEHGWFEARRILIGTRIELAVRAIYENFPGLRKSIDLLYPQ